MNFWIESRGYTIVEPANVRIANYVIPQKAVNTTYHATSVDRDIPHILEKLFLNTVSVRVVQKTTQQKFAIEREASDIDLNDEHKKHKFQKVVQSETRQLFLFVRDAIQKKCSKKEITLLCSRFVPLADCILFASGITPQLEQTFYRRGADCKREVQILQLKDATFDKLESRTVPHYVVLNESEIRALEERYQAKCDQFPRLRATLDASGRYLGLRPGMVVQSSPTSYRIVVN